jgi:neuronal PAS domain-containing protein 1/3
LHCFSVFGKQVEMTGSSIFDYIHHGDHEELAEQLGLTLASQSPRNGSGMTSPSSTDEPTGTIHNPDGELTKSSSDY